MFIQNTDEALVGGRAVAVPGLVHGLGELHRHFGRLAWSELFAPAVNLARFGFPVGSELAAALTTARAMFDTNLRMRAQFWNEVSNSPYKEGETLKQPLLADTLEAIANSSAAAFYHGKTARALVRDVRSIGGILTQRDLHVYKSKWREPLEAELVDGSRLQSAPAPSSGPVLLYAAALLNRMRAPCSQDLLFHRMVESFKYAYAKLNELSDEDFVSLSAVIHNIVRRDMTVQEAIEAPRLHHQLLPNVVVYEPQFSEEVLEFLRQRGHVLRPMERRPAAVNAIGRAQDRVIYAVADFRKGGIVDGY
ncbi:hypothetical protein V5799_003224 [Amblyomma americanum]|uniref:Uncharacterized protein n=1 Tax=Amblyomma americanum TaxID=6943 RepID=A0AAQ4D9K5_AMBAM